MNKFDFKTNPVNNSHKNMLKQALMQEHVAMQERHARVRKYAGWRSRLPVFAGALGVIVLLVTLSPVSPISPFRNNGGEQSCATTICFVEKAQAAYESISKIPAGMVRHEKYSVTTAGDWDSLVPVANPTATRTAVYESWTRSDSSRFSHDQAYIGEPTKQLVLYQDGLVKTYYELSERAKFEQQNRDIAFRLGISLEEYERTNGVSAPYQEPIAPYYECVDSVLKKDLGRYVTGIQGILSKIDNATSKEQQVQAVLNLLALNESRVQDFGVIRDSGLNRDVRKIQVEFMDSFSSLADHTTDTQTMTYLFDPSTFVILQYSYTSDQYDISTSEKKHVMHQFSQIGYEIDELIPESSVDKFDPEKQGMFLASQTVDRRAYVPENFVREEFVLAHDNGCYLYNTETKKWDLFSKDDAFRYLRDHGWDESAATYQVDTSYSGK